MSLTEPIHLSCRTNPNGGPARPPRVHGRRETVLNGRRIVILVHGFKNGEEKAARTWKGTRSTLAGLLDSASLGRREIVEFYWPGDPGRPRLLKAAFYARAVPIAQECGRMLGRYLCSNVYPAEVCFVGHSLGCRVVLEALVQMRSAPDGPARGTTLLMAAAVAEGLCDENREFGRRPPSTELAGSLRVLHSHKDAVLRFSFPLGQLAAETFENDPDPSPGARRAVGRSGGPARRWDHRNEVVSGHSDYWRMDETLRHVAEVVGRAATFAPPSHGLPEHRVASLGGT